MKMSLLVTGISNGLLRKVDVVRFYVDLSKYTSKIYALLEI